MKQLSHGKLLKGCQYFSDEREEPTTRQIKYTFIVSNLILVNSQLICHTDQIEGVRNPTAAL